MKILAFVDLHGNKNSLKKVMALHEKHRPDAIIAAGDLTMFENSIQTILFNLNSLRVPVMVVHGNHETAGSLRQACNRFSNIKFIHSERHVIGKTHFIGYGGGGFARVDEEFERLNKKFEAMLKGAEKSILTLHAPPHGTTLDYLHGEHVGNKSFTKFIYEIQPSLVICGHIHENRGKIDLIGKTKIVNPGPEGIIIEL